MTGFCITCPDHEACATGWSCSKVRAVHSAPQRWHAHQRIRHTGTLELGTVTAVDFEEDLVQIEDGRWWRIERVIEVSGCEHAVYMDGRCYECGAPHPEDCECGNHPLVPADSLRAPSQETAPTEAAPDAV